MLARGRSLAALGLATILFASTCGVAAADTGHTAIAAARARTNRYAEREATIHHTMYALGSCKLLHRKPWLAYNCSYVIHGLADQCRDVLTVAVVRQKNGVYSATAKKWSSSAVGAPC